MHLPSFSSATTASPSMFLLCLCPSENVITHSVSSSRQLHWESRPHSSCKPLSRTPPSRPWLSRSYPVRDRSGMTVPSAVVPHPGVPRTRHAVILSAAPALRPPHLWREEVPHVLLRLIQHERHLRPGLVPHCRLGVRVRRGERRSRTCPACCPGSARASRRPPPRRRPSSALRRFRRPTPLPLVWAGGRCGPLTRRPLTQKPALSPPCRGHLPGHCCPYAVPVPFAHAPPNRAAPPAPSRPKSQQASPFPVEAVASTQAQTS